MSKDEADGAGLSHRRYLNSTGRRRGRFKTSEKSKNRPDGAFRHIRDAAGQCPRGPFAAPQPPCRDERRDNVSQRHRKSGFLPAHLDGGGMVRGRRGNRRSGHRIGGRCDVHRRKRP
ncbi:hypothetical protein ACFQ07_14165, partial [Actinomadura adrarensis]